MRFHAAVTTGENRIARWFTRLACSPGHPEFSKSYSEMAGEAFAITSTNGVPAQRFAVAAADQ